MFRSLDDQLPSAEYLPYPPENEPEPDAVPLPFKQIYAIFFVSLAFIPLNAILGSFDTTSQVFPTHTRVEEFCYGFTALFAILAFATAAYVTRNLNLAPRLIFPFVIAMQLSGGLFMATDHIASFLEGAIDFPPGKTQTTQTLLPVSRAYQTHGKEAAQYIVTTPVWANLKITAEDYTYMLAHRSHEDGALNQDEILDFRYFCAKVIIQRTDKALRILHAGSQELPKGTIVLCPDALAHPPPLTP